MVPGRRDMCRPIWRWPWNTEDTLGIMLHIAAGTGHLMRVFLTGHFDSDILQEICYMVLSAWVIIMPSNNRSVEYIFGLINLLD